MISLPVNLIPSEAAGYRKPELNDVTYIPDRVFREQQRRDFKAIHYLFITRSNLGVICAAYLTAEIQC